MALIASTYFLLSHPGYGDTLSGTVISQTGYGSPAYSVSGSIPGFNLTYSRLTGESLVLYGDASISQYYNNTGSTTIYPFISGNAGFSLSAAGQSYGTYTTYVSASGAIPAHGSGYVGNTQQQVSTIAVPLNTTGSVGVTSNLGSGPGLKTSVGVGVVYTYTPIGLTQQDPIQPSRILNNVFTFSAIPSGRWLDPTPADGYDYQVTGVGSVITSVVLPTGFGSALQVFANGQSYGTFAGGSTFDAPTGTIDLRVLGFNPPPLEGDPNGAPLQVYLAGQTNGQYNLTMTPLPEPSTWWMTLGLLTGVGFACKNSRHRNHVS